jgi:hypothetical protein
MYELYYSGTLLIKNQPPHWETTEGLCLGSYGGPRVKAVSYERGTPVHRIWRKGVQGGHDDFGPQ